MGRLSLKFLGTPEVRYDGQVLKFPTRKALALLIYLLLEEGFHSREKLVALFWPESEARLGQAALRNTLARLRTALSQAGSPLLEEAGTLSFDFNIEFELDLHGVAAANQSIHTGKREITLLETAAVVYRGDFLEGFSLPDAPAFDEWAAFQREQCSRQMKEIFDRLSHLQAEARQFEASIATAARWIAHDPTDEAAHRRLMELHFMVGDRAAALQAYANCQTLLKTELGLEPSAETMALARRIRKDEGQTHLSSLRPAPSSFKDPPFVGRSIEHAQLAATYQLICHGQPQAVVIEGEAGIGKTRLVTEFLSWLTIQGADTLLGRAFEAGGRLPYQPIVDALRDRIERANAPDDLLSDIWLAELSRLLPELRERYPDLPPPTADETLAQARLLEAVARLGQALAQRAPVILFIDDVQWADTASLDLLHYLGRRWAENRAPILLLMTLRSEAVVTTPALQEWLSNLGRELPLTQLALGPITVEDTVQLVNTLAGKQKGEGAGGQGSKEGFTPAALVPHNSAQFGQWLFAETAGQPFFISETLKILIERGVLQSHSGPAGEWIIDFSETPPSLEREPASPLIPPGVRQVILARLNRLTARATELLTAAAIMGRRCSFEWLCQVASLTEIEGLPALDELLASRLLLEVNQPARPYTIAHDKIRDVVYTQAGDARRRIYHRRAFEALEKAAAPPAELAHHALAAQLSEPAFAYSVAAGDAAMDLFAVRDAIGHYEQASVLMGGEPRPETGTDISPHLESDLRSGHRSSTLHHLYTRLGRAYEIVGDYEQAQASGQALLTLARETGQPAMECAALNRLANLATYTSQLDTAAALLHQAVGVAEKSGDKTWLAETEWSLGQLAHHLNDMSASKTHAKRALGLARELDRQDLIAGTLNTLAYAHIYLGQIDTGITHMEEAKKIFAALGNKALEADCLTGLATANIWHGRPQAGITAAQEAQAISQQIDSLWGQIISGVQAAIGLVKIGEFEKGLAVAQQQLILARPYGGALLMIAAEAVGLALRALGAFAEARAVHLEAAPVMESSGITAYRELNAADLCVDAALAGDWPRAHSYARQALALRTYRTLPIIFTPHWPETEALLRGGDLTLAREDAGRWGQLAGHIPLYQVSQLRSLALLAQWDGDHKQAIVHLEAASTRAASIGLSEEQWSILAELWELYQLTGEETRAREAFERAVEIIQTLAAKIDDEGLRTRFMQAGPIKRILEGKM